MNLWQENSDEVSTARSSSMADVVFKIECRQLPVDHAAELAEALCKTAPWIKDLPGAGIHPIHVAGSQNGWQRPDSSGNEPLILSKRTRLRVRCPVDRAKDLVDALTGSQHRIGAENLDILSGRPVQLQQSAALFSRYLTYKNPPKDEDELLRNVLDECAALNFQPTKLLCGKSTIVSTAQGDLEARSLLIADVPPGFSLQLQENGLGDFRLMGCGIIIPHKDTEAVS